MVHQDFKRWVYKITSKILFRKNEIDSKYNILAFSVFKHEVEGCNAASWSAAGPFGRCLDNSSFRQQLTKLCHWEREKKKEEYAINVFLSLCYWVLTFLKFYVYGNVIKRIKRWRCVFYVFVFSNHLKKCCKSVWIMPNKHCNMYNKCMF